MVKKFWNKQDDGEAISISQNNEFSISKTTKHLWSLAYPTMIAMAMQSFYDIVDMTWLGQYSASALSGVTIFSVQMMLFTVLNEVAGASSVSMISQSYGRGDKERTQRISEQTISFKVVLAILSGLLMAIFLKPLLHLFTDSDEVLQHALEYGWIRIFFIPLMFSSYSVNTIFRCTGDSKTPMKIMLASTVLNFILDPIFIFDRVPDFGPIPIPFEIHGLGLGVFGAALATVISITVSFLYGFMILLSGKKDVTISIKGLLKLDKKIDLDLLKIGLPSGINQFVRSLFMSFLMFFVSTYGDFATALAGVGGRLNGLAFIPLFGLSMAGSTLVGYSLGREQVEEAQKTSIISAVMCTVIVAIITTLIFIFPEFILSFFFKDDPLIITEGIKMLRIMSISFILLGFTLGLQIVFSGSGHNSPMLYASIGSSWVVQLPFLFITVQLLKMPIYMVWVSFIAGEFAHMVIILYHYKKGVWKTKRV